MRVTLFGSTGLIGTAIGSVCKDRGIDCIAFNHREVDVRNPTALSVAIGETRPDVVVNAAGLVGINQCEDEPLLAFSVNTTSVGHLVNLCSMYDIVLVQPSTHNVFDGTKDGYYTEEDQPTPLQIYGVSKYASELVTRQWRRHYIIRFPTLFGKRLNGRSAFPDKIIDWIREGKEFKISYDKIDSPSYSIDVADTVMRLVEFGAPYGIYHVANSGSTNYYDFVQEISKDIGIEAKVTKVREIEFQTKAPNALKTAMASSKLQPLRTWQEALKEYLIER